MPSTLVTTLHVCPSEQLQGRRRVASGPSSKSQHQGAQLVSEPDLCGSDTHSCLPAVQVENADSSQRRGSQPMRTVSKRRKFVCGFSFF